MKKIKTFAIIIWFAIFGISNQVMGNNITDTVVQISNVDYGLLSKIEHHFLSILLIVGITSRIIGGGVDLFNKYHGNKRNIQEVTNIDGQKESVQKKYRTKNNYSEKYDSDDL